METTENKNKASKTPLQNAPHIRRLISVTDSTNVAAIGYNQEHNYLVIKFQRASDNEEGSVPDGIYAYRKVPMKVFCQLVNAPSMGKYFYQVIRANKRDYPFERLDDDFKLDSSGL